LDPHFLFNTLNTLVALIEEDPPRGVKFTQSLTDFFRKVAKTNQLTLITFEEELEIINNYYTLVKERFGEALSLNIDESVDKILKTYIPPLTLQILVENAIKHNEVSSSRKLHIDIESNNEYIIVSNNINKKIGQVESLGIGQKNIIERYKLLKGMLPSMQHKEAEYKFYLPIIKKE
jgi:LytS/YehU family sensor histidine kinase